MADLEAELVVQIPDSIKRVGVFVNESIERVEETVTKYELDYVQLHGDEDLDFANELRKRGIRIIKVFSISNELPAEVAEYEGVADFLLFDTATPDYGGSGKQFDWSILNDQKLSVPFLLSGGISEEDVEKIKDLDIPMLAGIDVNSKFEFQPGLKDLERIEKLKMSI